MKVNGSEKKYIMVQTYLVIKHYGHKLKLSRDNSFLLKFKYNLYRQAVIINFIYFVQINICFDYNDNDKGDDAIKKPQRGFST